jgi:hypothetical protein
MRVQSSKFKVQEVTMPDFGGHFVKMVVFPENAARRKK